MNQPRHPHAAAVDAETIYSKTLELYQRMDHELEFSCIRYRIEKYGLDAPLEVLLAPPLKRFQGKTAEQWAEDINEKAPEAPTPMTAERFRRRVKYQMNKCKVDRDEATNLAVQHMVDRYKSRRVL